MDYFRLRGIGVSPGIAMGKVRISGRIVFTARKESLPLSQVDKEIKRLRNALNRTKEQLIKIREHVKKKIGEEHSFIFDAHLLIL